MNSSELFLFGLFCMMGISAVYAYITYLYADDERRIFRAINSKLNEQVGKLNEQCSGHVSKIGEWKAYGEKVKKHMAKKDEEKIELEKRLREKIIELESFKTEAQSIQSSHKNLQYQIGQQQSHIFELKNDLKQINDLSAKFVQENSFLTA